MNDRSPAVLATEAPPRIKPSNYPEPFASLMAGRIKRPLGDLFGLKSFGVNLTRLVPGAVSALHHVHSRQDEFIYVIEGEPTLIIDAHHLENRSDKDCVILEVGDRVAGDEVSYPTDDLKAVMVDAKWQFFHKDGRAY